MTPVTRAQRIYCAAVGLFALWVGIWGFFVPAEVERALPWKVPPLHARFLGSVYFSAAVMLFGGMLARVWAEVRAVVLLVGIWTGWLLVVSLFHLDQFDAGHKPVWFWFFAYIVYPLVAAFWVWRHRHDRESASGAALPDWARRLFQVFGALFLVLAAAMLLGPQAMAELWPWKITPLLVQIYSAPFLAYGVASFTLSRARTWPEVRWVVIGALVFATGVLVASFIHRSLFTASRPATWIWFGGFVLLFTLLSWMVARLPRHGVAA